MAKDTDRVDRYELDGKTVYTVYRDGNCWFWAFTGDDAPTGPYTSREAATYWAKDESNRRNG